jgi:hypothetical protein
VTVGDSISDTATLSGGTSDISGTITFKLYSDATCSTLVTTLTNTSVSGNGNYGSGNYVTTAAGTYYWVASYGGDAKNSTATTACGDANESSVVGKAPSSIETAQQIFPQDSVTLSASIGGTPTGSVDFFLYGPNDTNCSGTPAYSQSNVSLSGGKASTSNTTFHVDAGTGAVYRWKVVYGGDAKHDGVTSSCGTERFTLTIANS